MKLKLYSKSIIDTIFRELRLSGLLLASDKRVHKNDEALREKLDSALALRLARLVGYYCILALPLDRSQDFVICS